MDFSWLTDWLIGALEWFGQLIKNGIIEIINALIVAIAAICDAVIALLPESSYTAPGTVESTWLGVVNWFLPLNHIIYSLGMYLAAVLVLFGIGPVLRWLKVVR